MTIKNFHFEKYSPASAAKNSGKARINQALVMKLSRTEENIKKGVFGLEIAEFAKKSDCNDMSKYSTNATKSEEKANITKFEKKTDYSDAKKSVTNGAERVRNEIISEADEMTAEGVGKLLGADVTIEPFEPLISKEKSHSGKDLIRGATQSFLANKPASHGKSNGADSPESYTETQEFLANKPYGGGKFMSEQPTFDELKDQTLAKLSQVPDSETKSFEEKKAEALRKLENYDASSGSSRTQSTKGRGHEYDHILNSSEASMDKDYGD